MARDFPTYSLSAETYAKSKGVFITRNIFPKCIAKVALLPTGSIGFHICQWWDEADNQEMEFAKQHMNKYVIAHRLKILDLFS
jgi:hypothetical protein